MTKTRRSHDKPLALAAVCMLSIAVACGGDDSVGETTETATTEPTTGDPTTSDPTTNDPTTSDPTTSDPTTSDPTTGDPTTDGDTETDGDPTTDGETEDPTDGDTDGAECEGLTNDDCEATDGCAWIGNPQAGFCATEGGGGIDVCESLGMQQRNAAPSCMWDQASQTCSAVGCDGLNQGTCTLAPACMWDADDMMCVDM